MADAWENWSGRLRFTPAEMALPRDEAELGNAIREAASRGRCVRPVGSGHSFTDLVQTPDVLVSLDKMQGLIDVDKTTLRATAWAGTKLWQFNPILDEHGLAMENLGDINKQSLGGALGTGTHGTGATLGSLATQTRGLTLVTASGETISCSETDNKDLFKAAQVSVGALGIVTRFVFQHVPAYKLHHVHGPAPFEECVANAGDYAKQNRHFEFYLFPHTDTVMTKFLNITDKPIRKWLNDVLLENHLFGLTAKLCRNKPSRCAGMSRFAAKCVSPGSEINTNHRVLCTPRLVRFNEMEYALPVEHGLTAIRELKEYIARENVEVQFPIEFRYIKGDDIWLSPFYGRDSVTISIHQFQGMEYQRYFRGAETIFRKHEGRPHWGKLHYLTARELEGLYPRWGDFQKIRNEIDPNGVFLNAHLRTLFVV